MPQFSSQASAQPSLVLFPTFTLNQKHSPFKARVLVVSLLGLMGSQVAYALDTTDVLLEAPFQDLTSLSTERDLLQLKEQPTPSSQTSNQLEQAESALNSSNSPDEVMDQPLKKSNKLTENIKTGLTSEKLKENQFDDSELQQKAEKQEPDALEKLEAVTSSEDAKIDPEAILPTYETPTEKENDSKTSTDKPLELKKPESSFFERLYEKYFGDEIGTVEKITVITNIVDADDLVENVQQALSQVSVEEFSDFRVALPRLRKMSTEAASAVGYYDATFKFKPINAKVLSVDITPGDPVKVTDSVIRIDGAGRDENELVNLLQSHELNKGDVFNSGKYDTLKAKMMLLAQRMGYFESRWRRSQVQVYLPQNTADVALVLETGPRYRFGETFYVDKNGDPYYAALSDQVTLDKSVFRKLKSYKADEPFEQQKVSQFSANLLSTQYFNAVDIKVISPKLAAQKPSSTLRFSDQAKAVEKSDSNDADRIDHIESVEGQVSTDLSQDITEGDTRKLLQQQIAREKSQKKGANSQQQQVSLLEKQAMRTKAVPVRVMLDSSKPNYAEVGLGYGTDSSFRVSGKVSRRLLNSHGDKLSANLALSKIKQAVQLKYMRPIGSPLDDTVTYFVGHNIERRESRSGKRDLKVNETTAGVQRDVLKYGWNHAFSLKYQSDKLKTDLPESEVKKFLVQFNDSRNQQALLFGYGAYKTVLSGGLNPYQGHKQQYQVEVASKSIVSDVNFARLSLSLDGLYSFGEENESQVLASLDAATILTDEFRGVPYTLRYFAGGDNSLRGYSYKSQSPKVDDYLIGGQHLVVGSLEYNHRIYEKWRLAAFFDVGNAYNKKFTNDTKYSAGIGARWESPVGPLRIDVAAGLAESSIPVRLHFFIGPPF